MRRVTPILLAILAGALATGAGMAVYLHKANIDRERLALLAEQTQQTAKSTEEKTQQAILEANQKVNDANAEVAKAQEAVKKLQDERDRLAHATPLPPADPKLLKGWKDVVNPTLGVSCKTPSTATIDTNDGTALTLSSEGQRWLSVTPYDARLEQELLASAATTTPVSYLVNGRLCTGWRGTTLNDSAELVILHAEANGSSTHLLWARTPIVKKDKEQAKDILQAALSSVIFAQ